MGAHENFFELGGHSLLATQAISRMCFVVQREIPLRVMFERPTVAGMAGYIEEALRSGVGVKVPPLRRGEGRGVQPLSFGQERLWFLDQLEPGSTHYNIPAAVRLGGRLDVGALRRSVSEVVRRHEVLRTRFEIREGQPVQVVEEEREVGLGVVDLSEVGGQEGRAAGARRSGKQEAGRGVRSGAWAGGEGCC